MKICIYGAGAIGGYLGVQLARAGADVSLVARGAHLAAMRERGLTLLAGEEKHTVHPRCTDDPAELGVQDYIIITLKAHSITGVIETMQPLLGPHTRIVTAVNGIPYWYFYKHGGQYENSTLESIDPGGRQWREIGAERAIGCIVYPATEIEAPGVIRHVYGNNFPLGEPSGEITPDVQRLADLFIAAGLKAPVLDRIRDEIWLKLWGNVCFNPISALTHATLDVICTDPATRALSRANHDGDARHRRNVRRQIPRRRRAPHRRCAQGRRAQDLDAPGSRARPPDGDRPARHRRAGDGPPHRRRHPRPRFSAGDGDPARPHCRSLRRHPDPIGSARTGGGVMAGEIKQWLRFRNSGATGFGTLTSSGISVHEGEMFGRHAATGKTLALSEVELLAPCVPSKIVALWNNFHALAAKLNQPEPPEPLYLLKATTSITTPGAVIRRPSYYDGKTTYEGELGIVIGKTCARVSPAEADSFIFGYTCVNDITANDILTSDPTFPQWARAKGIDDYGPFGPVIATGLDPVRLVVRTILNGAERQNYPISDMIFTAQELVSRISHDMTLLPGDLIAVGTSVGVGVMKEPVNIVTVAIDGIGELTNKFRL
ncbi:2-keto-4-pentenoate hydratase/2-oxohepta-3-ene-1,7-dioic acid hydratase in catechol pathway/ketopantoate reductase [Bradyrhizobium sp. GM22.5]